MFGLNTHVEMIVSKKEVRRTNMLPGKCSSSSLAMDQEILFGQWTYFFPKPKIIQKGLTYIRGLCT